MVLRFRSTCLVICCWTALVTLGHCASQSRRAIDAAISPNNSLQVQENGAVLPVGEAFNLFQNYGLLAFNINVAPLILVSPTSRASNSSAQPYQLPLFQMTTHPVLDGKMFNAEIKRQQVNNPRSIFSIF